VTLVSQAAALYEALISDKKANGDYYIVLRDGSPSWMGGVCHAEYGSRADRDTVFEFIDKVAGHLAGLDEDVSRDDAIESLNEIPSDVYTTDLTAWLHASDYNVYYITEVLQEQDIKDGFALLGAAQKKQIEEVGAILIDALTARQAEIVGDDGEDEDEDWTAGEDDDLIGSQDAYGDGETDVDGKGF